MPIVSTHHPPLTTRQLLVSVQNVAEAQAALDAGVEWIDLKDPSQGSLGRADHSLSLEVSRLLLAAERPVQISAALGEWQSIRSADSRLPNFPVVKIGLSDTAGLTLTDLHTAELQAQSQTHGTAIVWTLYADRHLAHAADLETVLQLTRRFRSPYLLIDTWQKRGEGLFDWMSVEEVEQVRRRASELGAALVVAGSLKSDHWDQLDQLGPVIIGVRGAVCQSGSDRSSQLCPTRLNQWLNWCKRKEYE